MDDLISREALLEKTKTIYTEVDGVLVTASVVTRTDIVMAPAVDAEPVRRGHWEKGDPTDANPYMARCSECGKLGLSDWVCCPRCGAKMDGVEK